MKIPLTELKPFPGNARRGNVDLLVESLRELGQYRPLIVNADRTVLAGNHTLEAAARLGWNEIECHLLDVDEQTARKINLVDNRSNDVATYDDVLLIDLLHEVESLTGTGYTDADLEKLIASSEKIEEPDPEPSMGGDLEYRIVVDCRDEAQQADLLQRFDAEGLTARPLIS